MTAPTGTSRTGISIHEAAVLLGVSPNTVRRWCAMGRLRSERIPRPQGATIRVYLDGEARQVPTEVPPGEVPGDVPTVVPPTSHDQVPDEDRSQAMAAWAASLLAPIAAELGAARQVIERQAEMIGRQGAELEAGRAEVTRVTAELAAAVACRRRYARWLWIALAAAGTLTVAAVLASAWVR